MDDDELAAILASAAAFDQSRERAMPVPAKRARDASRRVAEAALAARQQPSAADLAAAARATEAAAREQALQTPIAESNIGFKLALKCGWTPGTGLGKAGEGEVALVPLHLKADRRGLGGVPTRPDKPLAAAASSSRCASSNAAPALPSLSDQSIAAFRERIALSRDAARARQDRNQCVRILGVFDEEAEQAGSEVHVGANAERDERIASASSAVDDDPDDNASARPKRHKRAVLSHLEAEAPASDTEAEPEPESDEQVHAALLHLLARLRAKHRYCIYCATRFASDDEMRAVCPGAWRADH